jgi:TPR repeat protein
LNKQSTQRVTEIRFDHFPTTFGMSGDDGQVRFDPKTSELFFSVSVKFRDSNQRYKSGGFCNPEGELYRCQIECDGGSFYLKDRSAGSILLINKKGFRLNGCEDQGDRWLDPEPDDKLFLMHRLPDQSCTPPKRQAQLVGDTQTAASLNWESLESDIHGWKIEYPAALLALQPTTDYNASRIFLSADRKVRLGVFGSVNDFDTVAEYRDEVLGFGQSTGKYSNVTYSPLGDGWFVLSGLRGNLIYYEKYVFSPDRSLVQAFVVEYPQAQKGLYNDVAARVSKSFKYRDISQDANDGAPTIVQNTDEGANVGVAAGLNAGMQAYEVGNYATALKEWLPLARQGNAVAQRNLGILYFEGQGLQSNLLEASMWFQRSAEQGDAIAQYKLGWAYLTGNYVLREGASDYAKAEYWLHLSAEQGSAKAQLLLGQLYDYGWGATQGVPQDYAEAVKWYTLSAEQGDSIAQYLLADLYERGWGVPQDLAKATKWYLLSAEQGNDDAQSYIGYLYEEGIGVSQNYAEAAKWYRIIAEKGNSRGMRGLGDLYYNGWGVDQDYDEAATWYLQAAKIGSPAIGFELGNLYHKGWGVPQDLVTAYMWYEIAYVWGGYQKAAISRHSLTAEMTQAEISEAQGRATACWKSDWKKCD